MQVIQSGRFGAAVSPCTLAAGSLGASAVGPTITGTARAVAVPGGNTGTLEVKNVSVTAGSTIQWRVGAGTYESVVSVPTKIFADTNNVNFQLINSVDGEPAQTCDLYDYDTQTLIRAVSFVDSS
jgi:hypothetical protein